VNDAIRDYIIALATALRDHPEGRLGISPRATLTLLRASRAYAVTHRRDFVEPDDVKAVAVPVLAHRIGDPTVLDLPRARATIVDLLDHVPVPPPG
jgi:MoxR-like ATPase